DGASACAAEERNGAGDAVPGGAGGAEAAGGQPVESGGAGGDVRAAGAVVRFESAGGCAGGFVSGGGAIGRGDVGDERGERVLRDWRGGGADGDGAADGAADCEDGNRGWGDDAGGREA